MAAGSVLARALPVAVELPPALEAEVTAYIEREIGWQRVPASGPVRPALLLASQVRGGQANAGLPTVLITAGPVDALTVRRALVEGALDVLAWPDERARLIDCAARVPTAVLARVPRMVHVGAAAGGVGASTVTLALAARLVWSGQQVVVIGGQGLLRLAGCRAWAGPAAGELSRLHSSDAAREFARVARRSALPGLWLLAQGQGELNAAGWPVDVLLCDQGVAGVGQTDVVVARADASLEQVGASAAPVAVLAVGPWSAHDARRALGRQPEAWLLPSARVARAGVDGRVPVGLPRSYFDALGGLLAAGALAGVR